MPKVKLIDHLPSIAQSFDSLPQQVFKLSDFRVLAQTQGDFWQIDSPISAKQLATFLLKNASLRKIQLSFPGRPETRYLWRDPSPLQLANSLRPQGYFSHQTALYIHQLTYLPLDNLYINVEQSPKPKSTQAMSQVGIDLAFQNKPRITKFKANHDDMTFWILSGMNTNRAGVIEIRLSDGTTTPLTNVERTLIDIVVRPFYAGGLANVLQAFKRAREKLASKGLVQIYQKIGYVYPYHQAIGFYMERAGVYNDKDIEPLLSLPRDFDFYLTNQIESPRYSKKWRVYYPAELD